MKFISKFDRYITAIYFVTIITIVATSYYTFKESFISHSQRQQEAIIPLFSLITSDIIRPLTISQYMAKDPFLIDYIDQAQIDKNVISNYLTSITQQFKVLSFIAIEKHDLMVDSTGKQLDLSDKDNEWFHRLKAIDKQQFADFGNADNPHLYFDIKINSKQNKFLGFAGVAIDLDAFEKSFNQFHRRFGFELFFVDGNDNITLSTSKIMKTESHHRKDSLININTLPWYQHFLKKQQRTLLPLGKESTPEQNSTKETLKHTNKTFLNIGQDNLTISLLPLKSLNWRIFIIAPPAVEQTEYWQLFFGKLIIFIFVSVVLYSVFSFAINYFKSNLVKDSEKDYLTQLPNRSYIHWKFEQISKEYQNVCIVIADIDNFKAINDTYGHLVGDEVLKVIANKLSENLRSIDITGRWGGEEFIMILPDTTATLAQEIIDRIRINIAKIPFTPSSTSEQFNITVSFGICDSKLGGVTLEDIILNADKALYSAKENGRNQVVIHLD